MFWFSSVGTRTRDLCSTYFHAVGRRERGGWVGGTGEEGG